MKFNILKKKLKANSEIEPTNPKSEGQTEAKGLLQNNSSISDLVQVPNLGMRNFKTAIAVALSYLVFIPLDLLIPLSSSEAKWGGTYACIAAIICMQSSVEQSVKQGISRLIGTAIGGCLGILILTTGTMLAKPLFLALMLAAGTMATIWLCTLIKLPTACSISGITLCVILFNHSGPDRYIYALNRMFETVIGILIAVAVNRLLPDNRKAKKQVKGTPINK